MFSFLQVEEFPSPNESTTRVTEGIGSMSWKMLEMFDRDIDFSLPGQQYLSQDVFFFLNGTHPCCSWQHGQNVDKRFSCSSMNFSKAEDVADTADHKVTAQSPELGGKSRGWQESHLR